MRNEKQKNKSERMITHRPMSIGKNGKHHLPLVFVLSHLYPILPMVPFDDIVWEQGQKASRHIKTVSRASWKPRSLNSGPRCQMICGKPLCESTPVLRMPFSSCWTSGERMKVGYLVIYRNGCETHPAGPWSTGLLGEGWDYWITGLPG